GQFHLTVLPVRYLLSHQRPKRFVDCLTPMLRQGHYDAVIGFNKMPGLDVYYAADPCFQALAVRKRNWISRLGGRYPQYVAFEKAVFDAFANTEVLLLSESEKNNFVHYYGTPPERFHLLPPEIAADRFASVDAKAIRTALREELRILPQDKLVLMIGSGFRTKGLDRALIALSSLPNRDQVHLIVIGQDNARPFLRLAAQLEVGRQLRMLGGRDDVPRFLLGADLLIHPAYRENTGTVLLEAMASGLPVLTTDACGYAVHVQLAGAGHVLSSPFEQATLNARLNDMLNLSSPEAWGKSGIDYAKRLAHFNRAEFAADIIEEKARHKSRLIVPDSPGETTLDRAI
ncbi:MAG: glycosyltransferase, partial [Burkholderiales bacterium]